MLSRPLAVAAVAAVALLAGVVTASVLDRGGFDWERIGQPRNVVDVNGKLVPLPVPDSKPERMAPAVVTDAKGPFEWEATDANGPILQDPCRPIHWQLSTFGMPIGAEDVAIAAVDSVAAHTGLVFVYDGRTGSRPSFDGPLLVRGDGWEYAPMIIGWGSGDELADLGGDTTGVGGARISPGAYGDQQYFRTGTVILDTSDISAELVSSDDKTRTQAVLMHELGHVVGLDHVTDPNQLMYATSVGVTEWGPGDLQGLALAGAGSCEGA